MKKILSLVICLALVVAVFAGCTTVQPGTEASPSASAEPTQEATQAPAPSESASAEASASAVTGDTELNYDLTGKKIGVTFYDLTNPIWAATGENIVNIGKSLGAEVTLVSCEGVASTQVSQIENMITAKMDVIVIGPQDANALGDVVKKAKEAGILVMAYGQSMEGVDAQYVVENYAAGSIVGEAAGKWINENLGGKAKVGMLDYPLMEDIIDRADGIKDALKKTCPDAEIVATATSADAVTGMDAVETFLQANPDMKIVVCIGDGGAVGANEAVKAAGKSSADFGIFSVDGTEEAISAMLKGDPIRMTVGLGTPTQKAKQVVDLAARMILGQPFDKSEYTPMDPVDINNAQEYWDMAGYGK